MISLPLRVRNKSNKEKNQRTDIKNNEPKKIKIYYKEQYRNIKKK